MSALPIFRDYDGRYKVEGYEEYSFTTEADAKAAGAVAIHHFIGRYSQEMASESRRRRAAGKHKEQA